MPSLKFHNGGGHLFTTFLLQSLFKIISIFAVEDERPLAIVPLTNGFVKLF
jgi:hypothetical protein